MHAKRAIALTLLPQRTRAVGSRHWLVCYVSPASCWQLRDKSVDWKKDGEDVNDPFSPIYESLKGVLGHFGRKVDKAPLENLMELLQDIFAIKLAEILGDLHKDLKALASLRNVFAHGRELWLSFDQTDENLLSLDQNPLLLPAQRLLAAGVIKTLRFDGRTHHEFQRAFYSDSAMLYFLGRAREVESKLKELLTFPPEREMPLMVSLPELLA